MNSTGFRGTTLVELLAVLAISSVVGAIVLATWLTFQSRSLVDIGRNDLQDRAERLLRFLADDIREAAFLVGAVPTSATDTALQLVHDSRSGNPLALLNSAVLLQDGGAGTDDTLTVVKGVSFFPAIVTAETAAQAETVVTVNRRPNRPPGSSREILPAPKAIDHVVFANHKRCYRVISADLSLQLANGLFRPVPTGTEVAGVRAHQFFLKSSGTTRRLLFDNFTSNETLDDAVDGLQFELLLADGDSVDTTEVPEEVRAVRIHLLVRAITRDPDHIDRTIYRLGNRTYGPYEDHYRRVHVTQLVEVKNHGLP